MGWQYFITKISHYRLCNYFVIVDTVILSPLTTTTTTFQQQQQPPSTMELSETLTFEKGETDTYFAEYGEWNVHELMLKDQVRTAAYRQAIEANATLFKG